MTVFLRRLSIGVLIIIALAGLAYSGFALTARLALPRAWFTPREGQHTSLVFAHQGGAELRPENTMAAFQHAVAMDADVLDTDLHITQDGILVLIHDETVDRTTNGHGAIQDLALTQIKQLDAGYSFSPDEGKTFPFRGQGLTVPTLEELFQTFPDKLYSIEIKQTPPNIAQPFCALIRQYGMQDKVLTNSFLQANMDAFRKECPEVATSSTENEIRSFYVLSLLHLEGVYSPGYAALQVPEYSGGIHIVTPRFVEAARQRNDVVQPWTINEVADMKRMIALGVQGIITDRPDRLLELLK